ncbi:hypothetical protein VP018_001156 [Morganella morganii]|nr:hypothetical protein [Morganella morganii]
MRGSFFASNRDRVIDAGLRERQYLVLEPDAIYAQNKGYFDQLHHWVSDNGYKNCWRGCCRMT